MQGNRFEINTEGTITSDEIKLILEHYRIGKKPLAKLLGWGETTIIRYMEGDIPTSEYSNKLKNILEDPEFYYEILLKRKESLTNVAFRKSKKAVLNKIMSSKIFAVAFYLVNKCDAEICASYIQQLLYYIQAFSLALYDTEVFQDEYNLSSSAPYHKVFESMKRHGIHKLEEEEDILSEEEKELIDAVLEAFTWYGPKAMNALMAYEKSLLKVTRDKFNNKIISKDTMKNHFRGVMEQYMIKSVKEIKNYPDKYIMELKLIRG
jgi:uncharacterized phage-associated protein